MTVPVYRRAEMLDQLPLARDQAHLDALATEIQPNVRHNNPSLHIKTSRNEPHHGVP